MPRRSVLLSTAVLLTACAEEAPVGPPVDVAYDAACDSTFHDRVVRVEGYLHLFPTLLSCQPDGDGVQECQIDLLPRPDAPAETVGDRWSYLTLFVREGTGPDEVDARGYGIVYAPLPARAADSSAVGPGDRVRVTGLLRASPPIMPEPGEPLLQCILTGVERIELVERASPSWEKRQAASRDSLRTVIDSTRTARERRDSLAAAR